MKIVIDGTSVIRSNSGVARYTSELYLELKKILGRKIITYPIIDNMARHDEKKKFSRRVLNKFINFSRNIPSSYILRKKYDDFRFKKFTKKKFDIYHEPNFILKPFDGKKIVTVHDISWLKFSHYHPRNRVRFMKKYFLKSMSQANFIICVSNFVKKELIENFELPEKKIGVTYLAASTKFKLQLDEEIINNFLNYYKIQKDNFFLCVGTIEPRKNIENILDAFSRSKLYNLYGCKLVIAGNKGWQYKKILKKIKETIGTLYLENLSDEDLNILFASQKINLFISKNEGFGLPIVESMKFKKPVITSNNSSMKEIACEYSVLVDPDNIDNISSEMRRLYENNFYYNEYSMKSERRSNYFSWTSCAEKTLEIYKNVCQK
tara:strand:+ start:311 stop:1444 length:1134 start_codon:yes stop_codon:yes gene_type:complete